MIDIALKFLKDFLNQEIPDPVNLVTLGNITKESDIVNDKIFLSLVQVEEEKVLKEVNHRRRVNPGDDFFTTICSSCSYAGLVKSGFVKTFFPWRVMITLLNCLSASS